MLTLYKANLMAQGRRNDIIVVYDNFEFQENVKHQIIGEQPELRSVTTGKVISGADIPEGGLKQSMLNQSIGLEAKDIIDNNLGLYEDEIQMQLSTFFITEAINNVYPDAVGSIFSGYPTLRPRIPQLDVLPVRTTEHWTLGPIMYDEGSTGGHYGVTDSIFRDQLKPDLVVYSDGLVLAYGDQATAQLLRTIKAEQQEASQDYDRCEWILPVAAIFHLRMNFLYMVQRSHMNAAAVDPPSSLFHNMNFWGRKQIPSTKAPFHHLEELVLHRFDARVLGLLYTRLNYGGAAIEDPTNVQMRLSTMSHSEFLNLVEDIRLAAFSRQSRRPVKDSSIDIEFLNHIRFLQLVEIYKTLKHGVKYADIGLIKRVIGICCFLFEGSRQCRYALEMLHLYRLIASSATTPELKLAILSNSLVNLRGKEDSWQEVDLFLEHLNLELKRQLWARKNSTFDVDLLFETTALNGPYCAKIRTVIESQFGEYTNARHQLKSAADDIHMLAYELSYRSIRKSSSSRSSKFTAPDYLSDGIERFINEKRLQRFNERVIRTGPIAAAAPPATSGDDEDDGGVGGDADAGDEVDEYEGVDLPDDHPLHEVMVGVLS